MAPGDAQVQEERWRRWISGPGAGATFEEQWGRFGEIYSFRGAEDGPPPAWFPSPEVVEASNAGRLVEELGLAGFPELHRWSVEHRGSFWSRVIEELGIVFEHAPRKVLDLSRGVESPVWLPGARLNIARSALFANRERTAIVWSDEGSAEVRRVSRGDLAELAGRFAAGLAARGFAEGDAVGFYAPMNVECVAAYLGTVLAGGRVVSIASSFPVPELRRRLDLVECRWILTAEAYLRGGRTHELFSKVCEAGAPPAIVVPAAGEAVAGLRSKDLPWSDFLGATPVAAAAGAPERTTNVLFSSGTTGVPKAIPWTQLTPLKAAMDGRFHQDVRSGDVVAWPTDVGWMMGPWLIWASLLNGAAMALWEGAPTGRDFTRFVEEAGVTMLGLVPSLVRAWRGNGATEGVDWSGVRAFSSTGEPSSEEDYFWLMSRCGFRAPVIEYCGGTEIGGSYVTGSILQPASPATFTTPALGLDLVVLDGDGEVVAPGGSGEVFLLPPSIGLSQRLLNADHHETYYAGCAEGPRGEVLRRHGDELAVLFGGRYRAEGRVDDTMNLGGIKVSALEIERVVNAHSGIYESAAVAVPAPGRGPDRLVVFVVPADGVTLTEDVREELNRSLAGELSPLFKIARLETRKSLPRTASNKLVRRRLRADSTSPEPG